MSTAKPSDMDVSKRFSRREIEEILPHRNSATVLDWVEVFPLTNCATGHFLIKDDDSRIINHFGVMPGHWIAEFVHLIGAMLMLHETNGGIIPVLNQSTIKMHRAALPKDTLSGVVCLNKDDAKHYVFTGTVKNQSGELVANVVFSGSSISHRLFNRLTRQKQAE